MRSILEVGSEQLCQKKGYNKNSMITKIDRELAEQIVNTIKDVCDHDINFIAPSGIILASTDSSRVGTFHEIGQQAAASGSVLEVTEDNNFSGTKQGINLPLYHNEHLLAVIGITGIPDKVRSYAYLAERITNLLIREQELNQYSRRQADKKHFVIQSLIRNETDNQEYLTSCLHEFKIDLNTKKRIVLIRTNKQNPITNRSVLEQKIQQMFAQAHVCLHTFNYPGDFIALIEETDFEKQNYIFKLFAKEHFDILDIAVGKPTSLFQLHISYQSAETALHSLIISSEHYVIFDDLTLELILSTITPENQKEFLAKTIAPLNAQELHLLEVYFSEEMSLAATSERLFLHKNTLQYKLNAIQKKCSLNPRKFQDAVLLYLAGKIK